MVDDLMLESFLLESLIGHERIGVDRAARFDVGANIGLQRVLFAIADYSGANLTTAFQNPQDGGFVFGARLRNPALALIGVHETGGATNESFVHFDLAIGTAKFHKQAGLHRQPDAVKHEPRRLLSDAKSAGHFVRANAILAVGNHPNSDEPLVQRKPRILKDSPNFDRELPFGMDALALPLALILKEYGILAATGGACDAIRPAEFRDTVQAVVGISKVENGLLESLWLGAHGVPHKRNLPK